MKRHLPFWILLLCGLLALGLTPGCDDDDDGGDSIAARPLTGPALAKNLNGFSRSPGSPPRAPVRRNQWAPHAESRWRPP